MSNPTAVAPPLFPDPNEWNGQSVAPCAAVALALAVVAVALRCWCRAWALRIFALEDWLIVAAVVGFRWGLCSTLELNIC